MTNAEKHMNDALQKRVHQNALRELVLPNNQLIDFASNDYLGLVKQVLSRGLYEFGNRLENEQFNSSIGSRLLTGNSAFAEQLEARIAKHHKAEAALLFSSGYAANLGLISALGTEGTTFIYDELAHASIHDGIRLSKATTLRFRHNDLAHLEERLSSARGATFVVVESIYSMDGDLAPLTAIVALCKQHNASLIVDEAHATGVFGEKGSGLVCANELQNDVFARVHTFGKALGAHGAAVVGGAQLRQFLINFCRPFIYTTSLPPTVLQAIDHAYSFVEVDDSIRLKLSDLIDRFRVEAERCSIAGLLPQSGPIQTVICPGNDAVKSLANAVQQLGFDVRPILSPTVPKGKERLRICLHAFNTEAQVEELLSSIKKAL